MAERNQESFPFAPYANGQAMARSDAESATDHSQALRKKKRIRCLVYIAVFAVFQIVVITVFALTVMRVKSPKFRIRSVTIEELTTDTNTANPSLNLRFIAETTVKNPNFGRYKFEESSITVVYGGTVIGDVAVPKATARTRATRRATVTGDVTTANSNLGNDVSSGFVTLNTISTLRGKVYLMNMIKKSKSAEMNCTFNINLTEKVVREISCK